MSETECKIPRHEGVIHAKYYLVKFTLILLYILLPERDIAIAIVLTL